MKSCKDFEALQLTETREIFRDDHVHDCKGRVFSMDVAEQAQYMVTGHDKLLTLWKLPAMEKVWDKKLGEDRTTETGNKVRRDDKVQLRVLIDKFASVIVSASTDKKVTVYEAASGNLVCQVSPGEITTAMCLSNNLRHLITASDKGLIYVWRLPDHISQALIKVRKDSLRKIEDMERIPTVIEEADQEEEEGSFRRKREADGEAEEEEDFDFNVPSKF